MSVAQCSQCQAEIFEGVETCPKCGLVVVRTKPVNGAPAMAGAAFFTFILLASEWFHILWPAVLAGTTFLVFLILKYGKLAYVAPPPSSAKIEVEVPVGELLEKVEVPEAMLETETVCPHCGNKVEVTRFCGNCGKPLQVVEQVPIQDQQAETL